VVNGALLQLTRTPDQCERETRNEKRATFSPQDSVLSRHVILKPVLASIDALPDGARYVI